MNSVVTKSGILIAAGLAILVIAVPVCAQTGPMRMEIPFSFLAGEQRLPSGTYWVRLDGNFHTLDLRPVNERTIVRMRVHDGRATRNSWAGHPGVLSFHKYGSTLVLKGVFAPGASERHDLRTSKAEVELARAAALPTAGGDATIDLQSR